MESEPNNFLNWVEIKNFKSIKDLRLDCKRVNVFVGKPNVGKSNILEGLGLLGGSLDDRKYLNGAVRYEEIRELFIDHDTEQKIQVSSNQLNASLSIDPFLRSTAIQFMLQWERRRSSERTFYLTSKGNVGAAAAGPKMVDADSDEPESDYDLYRVSPVKKYDFLALDTFKNTFSQYLLPPHGWNMYEVINRNPALWQEFAQLFQEQSLEFILSDGDQSFVLQKKEGARVKQYPFLSVADTFRRFMFYITAIESNKDSVIIFEEPEVHSFPPYVKALAHRIVYSETNQFFVSTHSPYLLQTLIRELDPADLSVFITYYKDYQTQVRALTTEELQEAEDLSIDLFYNLSRYEPNA